MALCGTRGSSQVSFSSGKTVDAEYPCGLTQSGIVNPSTFSSRHSQRRSRNHVGAQTAVCCGNLLIPNTQSQSLHQTDIIHNVPSKGDGHTTSDICFRSTFLKVFTALTLLLWLGLSLLSPLPVCVRSLSEASESLISDHLWNLYEPPPPFLATSSRAGFLPVRVRCKDGELWIVTCAPALIHTSRNQMVLDVPGNWCMKLSLKIAQLSLWHTYSFPGIWQSWSCIWVSLSFWENPEPLQFLWALAYSLTDIARRNGRNWYTILMASSERKAIPRVSWCTQQLQKVLSLWSRITENYISSLSSFHENLFFLKQHVTKLACKSWGAVLWFHFHNSYLPWCLSWNSH